MIFKCKYCGANLEITPEASVITCNYCDTPQAIPNLDDEKRANLYDRANHFRRINEYDKASGFYEKLLNEDHTDAEAYWSLALCHYGIEFVNDSKTHRKIPTINRMQYTSFFEDADFLSALKYADASQTMVYEEFAKEINRIQKGILEISKKEEPFDVFICYKETDDTGGRTQDSILAQEMYNQLTKEGYKVFFSRITLEDKIGSAYEPYIFTALNSAKVMIVVGTKPKHFNALWVKNEWSRFLYQIKEDPSKVLIPAYKDMDAYDLPEELTYLQALDMSKLGFMQNLVHGIKKYVLQETEKSYEIKAANTSEIDFERKVENCQTYLKLQNYEMATEVCNALVRDFPEKYQGWWGLIQSWTRQFSKEVTVPARKELGKLFNYVKELCPENEFESIEKTFFDYISKISKTEANKEAIVIQQKIKSLESDRNRLNLEIANKKSYINDLQKQIDSTDTESKRSEIRKILGEKNISYDGEKAIFFVIPYLSISITICIGLSAWIIIPVLIFSGVGIYFFIKQLIKENTINDLVTTEINHIKTRLTNDQNEAYDEMERTTQSFNDTEERIKQHKAYLSLKKSDIEEYWFAVSCKNFEIERMIPENVKQIRDNALRENPSLKTLYPV